MKACIYSALHVPSTKYSIYIYIYMRASEMAIYINAEYIDNMINYYWKMSLVYLARTYILNSSTYIFNLIY